MPVASPPPIHPLEVDAQHTRIVTTSLKPNAATLVAFDGSQSRPEAFALSRHYTSLQEYADHVPNPMVASDDVGLTPRYENRREYFMLDQRPSLEDKRRNCRNPLPPAQQRAASPPPLEEIMRRKTIDDADSSQNLGLTHTSTDVYRTPSEEISRYDTRRSSIALFAKGMVRHVPNLRMFASPSITDRSRRRDSHDAALNKAVKKDRRLSFAPLPTATATQSYEMPSKISSFRTAPSIPLSKPEVIDLTASGGLKDRRKVKLDLTMPIRLAALPARNRSPVGGLSSLTPAHPRSPKTPWIRNDQPKWELAAISKSAPILEEDYIQANVIGHDPRDQDGLDLLPDTDILFSSHSPNFSPQPLKVRDRCYITRPSFKRNRSGRIGTSETGYGQSPDSVRSTDEQHTSCEQQARTTNELQELGRSAKQARTSRWRWKQSSDEGLQSPEPTGRRFSLNILKRSNRLADQNFEKDNEKKQTNSPTRVWRSNQPVSTYQDSHTTIASPSVPPAFVPPGVSRVPTPPIFDANGEVKGKLADFFFDMQGGAISRRRTKASPGGYWNSDALLMSLTTDMGLDTDDEDEGPGGPLDGPSTTLLHFDVNGTPGLKNGEEGYLDVGPVSPGNRVVEQEAWFRVHHDNALDLDTITALAHNKKEEELRRRFDWMVPEHLPTSPLCPLHEKYKGSLTGLCYWHSRRQPGSRAIIPGEYASGRDANGNLKQMSSRLAGGKSTQEGSISPGWDAGIFDAPLRDVKIRRLESLSSP